MPVIAASSTRLPQVLSACLFSGTLIAWPWIWSGPAHAAGGLFDPPLAVETVPAGSDPTGQRRCTRYSDMTVLETGTDSPAPGAAAVVAAGQPCRPGPPGIALSTAHFAFRGRKGPFLLFEAADPNGAVPFLVVQIGTGRVIYRDSWTARGELAGAVLTDAGLRLQYRRAINSPCSLAQDGASCWVSLARAGLIPSVVARSPTPACAAAYHTIRAPAANLSIVSYDVEIALSLQGRANVLSRGAPACEPAP